MEVLRERNFCVTKNIPQNIDVESNGAISGEQYFVCNYVLGDKQHDAVSHV